MLARHLKLPALILDFIEQAHVFDGNRRLIGKGLNQLDLFVGERVHLRARQRQDADRHALAQHRHGEYGAKMTEPLRVGKAIVRVGQHVGDMDEFAFEQRAATCVSALRHDRKVLDVFHELLRETIRLRAIKNSTLLAGDGGTVGLAKASGRFNKCL